MFNIYLVKQLYAGNYQEGVLKITDANDNLLAEIDADKREIDLSCLSGFVGSRGKLININLIKVTRKMVPIYLLRVEGEYIEFTEC